MKLNYYTVVVTAVSLALAHPFFAQTSIPEFLNTSDEPVSLCIEDEGVRLTANNQIYLGEEHPDATAGRVHLTRSTRIRAHCGTQIRYQVEAFIHDTSQAYLLVAPTLVDLDSSGEADLGFDTEQSADMYIRAQGLPYGTGCMPYHRIRWTVIDSCGNEVTSETRIRLYDCFLPSAEGIEGYFTYMFPAGCLINLHAVDLVLNPLDDTSAKEDMLLSFNPNQYQPVITLDACDIPAFGVVDPWVVWIIDGGLDANCDGHIEWDERQASLQVAHIIFFDNGSCCCLGGEGMLAIQGKIHNAPDGEGIPLVHVSFLQPMQFYPTYVTDDSGDYQLSPVTPTADMPLTIRPARNDHHRLGVSTLDLVKIQKHLLGIEPLSGPYKHIAADINNSQSVSAIDLVELRKLLLGRYIEYPNNTSWRFVREDFVFQDSMDPWMGMSWSMPPSFQEIVLTQLDTLPNLNFIGVKVGDITGTYDPNATTPFVSRSAVSEVVLRTMVRQLDQGQRVEIPVFVKTASEAIGFQFTLTHPGLGLIAVQSGQIDVGEDDIAIFDDHTTMSWFDLQPISLHPDIPLFTLTCIARESGSLDHLLHLSSDMTEAEWYVSEEQILHPKLKFDILPEGLSDKRLQIYPNPWSDATSIRCTLSSPGEIRLSITDALGRTVYHKFQYSDGDPIEFLVTQDEVPLSGTYFITVSSAHGQATGKMLRIKP